MGERPAERYVEEVASALVGSRRSRARLLAEIRDHLQDGVNAGRRAGLPVVEAERQAVELLGPPTALIEGWEARRSRLRRRRHGRGAIVVAAIAVASILAAAQHAQGRRNPAPVPSAAIHRSIARPEGIGPAPRDGSGRDRGTPHAGPVTP